jgi:hypothetical protein
VNFPITDCKLIQVDGPVAVDTKTEVVFADLHQCTGCASCTNCLVPVYCSTCGSPLNRRRGLIRFRVEYYEYFPYDYTNNVLFTNPMSKILFTYSETFTTTGTKAISITGVPVGVTQLTSISSITVNDIPEFIQMVCQKFTLFINQELECFVQVQTNRFNNVTLNVDLGDSKPQLNINPMSNMQ